jgi:predicted permease
VILIVLAIAAAVAIGIGAEHRWGERAQEAARQSLRFVELAITVTLAWLMATRVLRLERPAVGAVMCCALLANTGYLGYPMTIALLGSHALSQGVVFDLFTQTPTLLLGGFAIGAAFGSEAGEGARERAISFLTRNPPLYAAILALLVPDSLAPHSLVEASRVLVFAILPVGFFAVGVQLAAEAEEGQLRIPPRLTAPVATAVGLRLIVAPGLLFLMALPLIELPDPYLLMAAMPSGINTMLIAHAYGLNLRITAESVTISTGIVVLAGLVASFVT